MKKIFGFRNKGPSPLGASTRLRSNCVGFGHESAAGSAPSPRYHLQDKEMGKIHKAASAGDVAKVQHILILGKNGVNDRDKKDRTALHFACACGHPEVVTLLVERKCELDACDNEKCTALVKAIQCQEEECATILLEHGANPNMMDAMGNTALHYAVYNESISVAAKLLAHGANMEAKNKDDLTPLLLAVKENKQQIVEFLVKKKTNTYAADKLGRNKQPLFEYDEKRPKTSEDSNPVLAVEPKASSMLADNSSEDDSSSRLSGTPGPGDSWPTSDEDDFNFDTKNVPKVNLTELWTAAQQSRRNQAKYDFKKLENRVTFDNSNSDSENEGVVEITPKTSVKVQKFSLPSYLSPEPMEGAVEPAIRKEENGTNIENVSQEQPTNNNLTYGDGRHKNNKSELMSALGFGEDEAAESPWESESISENLSLKCVGRLYGSSGQKGENIVNEQEDVVYIPSCMSGSRNFNMAKLEDSRNMSVAQMEATKKAPDLETTLEIKDSVLNKAASMKNTQAFKSDPDLEILSGKGQKRLSGSENVQLQVQEKKKYEGNETEVSGNLHGDAAPSDERQNQQNGKTDSQRPLKENEEHDGVWRVMEFKEPPTFTSSPALPMKEAKRKENEKWGSEESVTASVMERAESPAGGPLRMKDNCCLSDVDQHEARTTMKTSSKNNKVKKQTNTVDELEDLTESSETASEDCTLPCPNYESVLLQIEQLRMECKDIVGLLKIRDAIHSYKRVIEFKKSRCELLTGKIRRMENKMNGLQKELSEMKEVKSQLEHEKVEWEQELSHLRFALKQEDEKRRSTNQIYEKIMEQLRKKEEQYNKEVEIKQQLEISLRTLDMELKTVRNNLNQVLEERNDIQRQLSREQNARILQDGILANHLCKQKEIEMAQKKMTSEVSVSHEKEKDLLYKNQKLQDEIAMLRLEIDTIKNHNQEKEKKYLEDIEVANEKNDNLQRMIKLNEEKFTKTIFQYNGQLNLLTTENAMLSSKLENEKQNKERLETEIESYRSRLTSAIHDHGETQTSKRDLEIAFQREREEWFRLQDKMNFDISNLKDNNEILSQQLSKTEKKFNSLEIEFHHTRDDLREKTLVLKQVQRDLSQTQCQMKEVEQMYQNEQSKVNKYIGKQESIEERLSQLQSENMLLRQQLDDAYNKADSKDKTVINIQDQFHDMMKKLQAESKKQNLMLEDRNKELLDECNHLKERMYQYENEKTERDVIMRQLQQELADTLKKQSMSEASLEVSSRYRITLEDETRDLKKKLGQIRSQLQEAQDQHREAVQSAEKMQDHLQKLELEKAKFKITIKGQEEKIEQLQESLLNAHLSEDEKEQLQKLTELKQSLEYTLEQEQKKNDELEKELTGFKKLLKMTEKKLSEHENREFSLHQQDIKPNQFEMDVTTNTLINKIEELTAKLETTSSKCLHLDKKNQFLQQELLSMKTIQKKCGKLEKNKKKLEQDVVNLQNHIEKNMVDHVQVEQYKREIEERARQDLVEKLKQVNLFLQTQAASQENLEQLRENTNASVRNQMELRIKNLECELSKMKSQEDFSKIELEKYKQLYQEEFKIRKSLSKKLSKTNEKLEEASTKLLLEEQQNRSLLGSLSTRPVVECPCVGNLHNSLVFSGTFIPRQNLVIPTSNSQPSSKKMEIYLTKMQHELEKSINRELKEATTELESGFLRASPLGCTTKSSQDLLSEVPQEYADILKKKFTIY